MFFLFQLDVTNQNNEVLMQQMIAMNKKIDFLVKNASASASGASFFPLNKIEDLLVLDDKLRKEPALCVAVVSVAYIYLSYFHIFKFSITNFRKIS
jgi:hypothetical protein